MTASPTAIAIMAAGLSTRFGQDKLVMPFLGRPLYAWALGTARAISPSVYLVVDGSARSATLGGKAVRRLVNPEPALGLGSSIAIAARAARADGHSALLVMLADMPLVTPATLERLVAAHGEAVGCRYPDGASGVPAIFRATALDRLARAGDPSGARAQLLAAGAPPVTPATADELLDVDTPAMLAGAEAALRARH